MYADLLKTHLQHGTLTLRFADGTAQRFGDGAPNVEWRLRSRRTLRRILRDPGLALGETYMDGEWSVADGRLRELVGLLVRNFAPLAESRGRFALLRAAGKLLQGLNGVRRSYTNAAHHYDLDESLFRAFLDKDMHYSCAYFARPEMTLEQAQEAKCRHILRKLCLRPGQAVLDIGCGWGSLAVHLARRAGVYVTGITLSREQLRVAREQAAALHLDERVQFRLEDYREHRGSYDRIVSVGMFEHVGKPFHQRFFTCVRRLLRHDGVALLHTIGRSAMPSPTNPWIRKYIFPGGYIPALSEVTAAIERSRLLCTDIEILRLHYAETLAAWSERFSRHRTWIAERMGERFCRMWEFYLASCEAAFRWWDLDVFQVQLARERSTVALTRDYLYAADSPALSIAPAARAAPASPP